MRHGPGPGEGLTGPAGLAGDGRGAAAVWTDEPRRGIAESLLLHTGDVASVLTCLSLAVRPVVKWSRASASALLRSGGGGL